MEFEYENQMSRTKEMERVWAWEEDPVIEIKRIPEESQDQSPRMDKELFNVFIAMKKVIWEGPVLKEINPAAIVEEGYNSSDVLVVATNGTEK